MDLILYNIDKIKLLCEQHHVASLFAFGSITRNQLTPTSDVDFIVDIEDKDPLLYADDYFALKFELAELLKRDIDLLESKSLKNKFLLEVINNTKVLVYGKGN
ncbi:nucleotidyltransferase family protein [Flavobacterium sp.]|uniref:nucleotidyltransferase family protein n=1 Tax=Flavobacterium sp. TaxID=239 RepID=UPI0038D11403